jgi:hypothetical protein
MKITTEVTHKVDYFDLQEEIKRVYEKEFDILEDLNANNDSSLETKVQPKVDKFDQDIIDKWVQTGEGSFLTRALMNDLCAKGHIPEGSYVIRICW